MNMLNELMRRNRSYRRFYEEVAVDLQMLRERLTWAGWPHRGGIFSP